MTNFKNGVSSMGIPVIGGDLPATKGKYFFVDYTDGNDSNSGHTIDKPLKTIAQAYSLARTNKDDVIVLMGNASHVLTSMLSITKSRVHFIGMDGLGGRAYGQNAKISLGITTAATDIAAVQNSGVRNSFTNIKFISNNTKDESLYCFIESGEYTVLNNCEIYKSTDLDVTGASELVMNGDSFQMFGGTIGSLANAQTGTVVRPVITFGKLATVGTKQAREVLFEGVRILKSTAHTTGTFVTVTADADLQRSAEFKNCAFINAANSAATPAVAIATGASLTVGQIICSGGTYEVGCTALATATGVFSSLPTYTAGGGSAVQTT